MTPSSSNDGSSPDVGGAGWRYPAGPGDDPAPASKPPPPYQEFFNAVWLELIDLPPISDTVMSRVQTGLRVPVLPIARDTLASIQVTHVPNLRPMFLPPAKVQYVAFPLENGRCDVIRGRYRAPPYMVDVAFANLIWSTRLVGTIAAPGEKPLETATRMARLVFDDSLPPASPIHLMQVNDSDGTTATPAYGCHDTSKGSYRAEAPHWVDYLCWWLRPHEIGFVSMWGRGGPSRAVLRPSAEDNKYWFSPRPKK